MDKEELQAEEVTEILGPRPEQEQEI